MTLAQGCPAPQRKPSVDHLMDAPLSQLLVEFGVEVSTLETDAGYTGGAYARSDGSLLFVRPAGRPESEWQMMARAMLGWVLRVPLPELPEMYQLTEL